MPRKVSVRPIVLIDDLSIICQSVNDLSIIETYGPLHNPSRRRHGPSSAAGDAGRGQGAGVSRVGLSDGDTIAGRGAWQEEDEEKGQREDLDQVVHYYDVATAWIRPVDIKVCRGCIANVSFCSFVFRGSLTW